MENNKFFSVYTSNQSKDILFVDESDNFKERKQNDNFYSTYELYLKNYFRFAGRYEKSNETQLKSMLQSNLSFNVINNEDFYNEVKNRKGMFLFEIINKDMISYELSKNEKMPKDVKMFFLARNKEDIFENLKDLIKSKKLNIDLKENDINLLKVPTSQNEGSALRFNLDYVTADNFSKIFNSIINNQKIDQKDFKFLEKLKKNIDYVIKEDYETRHPYKDFVIKEISNKIKELKKSKNKEF